MEVIGILQQEAGHHPETVTAYCLSRLNSTHLLYSTPVLQAVDVVHTHPFRGEQETIHTSLRVSPWACAWPHLDGAHEVPAPVDDTRGYVPDAMGVVQQLILPEERPVVLRNESHKS